MTDAWWSDWIPWGAFIGLTVVYMLVSIVYLELKWSIRLKIRKKSTDRDFLLCHHWSPCKQGFQSSAEFFDHTPSNREVTEQSTANNNSVDSSSPTTETPRRNQSMKL